MRLQSSAFQAGNQIPSRFTCDGSAVSPPLTWQEVPQGTRSFALILEDPDAPSGIYTHWLVYNLPQSARNLGEAVAVNGLSQATKLGINDAQQPGYGAPCPPAGRHRYRYRLYALDTVLPDLGFPDRAILLKAIEGHVLATAELVGTYQRH